MTRLTKRQKAIAEKVDPEKIYDIEEAVTVLSDLAKTKFAEAFDVSVNLGVDPKKSDQVVRGATTLPHGTGKSVRVAVITQGDNADKASAAGADLVGFEDLADSIKGGTMDFDVLIATPDAMRLVGQLGKILGPRGLMPNPKSGTVTQDIAKTVAAFKAGRVEYRNDRYGNVHLPIGRVSFSADQLAENLAAAAGEIIRAKPAAAKGRYLNKVAASSTMGPGIRIDTSDLEDLVKASR